jgi:parallel beta-helix repeat protein
MKKASLPAALLALCVGVLLPARAVAQGTTRVVADDGRASLVSCEAANPAPRSIQAAINLSASGDRILVCPGVYEEQLKIVAKDLSIRGVTSGALSQVLIKPSGVVANSTNTYSGAPVAAVVAVEDAASVVLRSLIIDGGDNGLTDCDPTLVGVFYRNASGEVQETVVRDIRLGAALESCPSGYGIFAQSSANAVSKLTVEGGSVHGYQKVGIVGNEWGTELQAVSTTVAGDGAITTIAQNGIQIGFGATGRIARSSILNHVYTCPTFPCDASTNILVYEAHHVTVAGNETGKAAIGIYLVRSDDNEVQNNKVSDTDVFDGIAVIGNRNHVHLNRIVNSDEFAVSVEGDGNLVENNEINEAACGIFSSGAGNRLLLNTILNTELTTCEPFTLSFKALLLDPRGRSSFSAGLVLGATSGVVARDAAGMVLRAPTPAR